MGGRGKFIARGELAESVVNITIGNGIYVYNVITVTIIKAVVKDIGGYYVCSNC